MLKRVTICLSFVFCANAYGQIHYQKDFNDLNLTGWTTVDNDIDAPPPSGINYDQWYVSDCSDFYSELGTGTAVSHSWVSFVDYHPNNLLISPPIDLTMAPAQGLKLYYYAGSSAIAPLNQDHYAVYVTAANDTATILNSTPVFEETISYVGMDVRIVDLSAYAGQTVYLTFRHFNTVGMRLFFLDDIVIKNIPSNNVALQDVTLNRYSLANNDNVLTADIENVGANTVTSVTLNWNDGTAHSQEITGLNIVSGATATVTHPVFVNYPTVSENDITVTVTAVNGVPDSEPDNNSQSTTINIVSVSGVKRVVIEEGTGTWCGYCPRGAVALEYMYNLYPETFIGIAVHSQDTMANDEYAYYSGYTGLPSCNVDRFMLDQNVGDPLFEAFYQERITEITPADLSVSASGVGSELAVNVTATFHIVDTNAAYRFAVVLKENNVTGSGPAFDQVNYFHGGSNGSLNGAGHDWTTAGDPVPASEMHYDHVGRTLLGGYFGEEASVPVALTNGQTVNYTFNYTIPSEYNRSHMQAVALLLGENGEILTAAEITSLLATEEYQTTKLHVYPNPSRDMVAVSFESKSGEYLVTLRDVTGRVVKQQRVTENEGTATVFLNIRELNKGNYFVTVSNGTAAHTEKLSIN